MKCKYTLQDCQKLAKSRKGKCLSHTYVGAQKLEWKCQKGHVWSARFSHVKQGTWCSICFKENLSKGFHRTTKEEVVKFIELKNWKFLDSEFKSVDTMHKWQCSNNHIFKKRFRNIKHSNIGCPDCNNSFASEKRVRSLIENFTGHLFPKIRPKWLRSPETNYCLELDGYCEQLNLAFEYDGQFHYEVRKGINNNLERTLKNDQYKNEILKSLGIKLIRIPYFLKDSEIINLFKQEIK